MHWNWVVTKEFTLSAQKKLSEHSAFNNNLKGDFYGNHQENYQEVLLG